MRWVSLLAFTDADGWRPGIGDPTALGWLTVVGYAAAAVLCLRQARREHFERARKFFWSCLGIFLLLLGINKQLDLQTWLTLTGRKLARSEGWYEHRRAVQMIFIALIVAGTLGAVGGLGRWVSSRHPDLWLPLAGFALVLCFVIVRAASFHHVDQFLHWRLFGFKMNWLLELGGISVVIVGALHSRRPLPPPGPRPSSSGVEPQDA